MASPWRSPVCEVRIISCGTLLVSLNWRLLTFHPKLLQDPLKTFYDKSHPLGQLLCKHRESFLQFLVFWISVWLILVFQPPFSLLPLLKARLITLGAICCRIEGDLSASAPFALPLPFTLALQKKSPSVWLALFIESKLLSEDKRQTRKDCCCLQVWRPGLETKCTKNL